ncbi:hypothetical protein FBY39_1861 [Microbacterium sp. SLBN-146]|nr:hypothetical protein FBY39_1861 [Microbacterium sp. SLBN-146]
MEFDAAGGDPEVGVWMTAAIEGSPPPIAAVDGFAQQFTVWPGTINGEELSIVEPGAEDAIACLE